jgi:hypothetical protein
MFVFITDITSNVVAPAVYNGHSAGSHRKSPQGR